MDEPNPNSSRHLVPDNSVDAPSGSNASAVPSHNQPPVSPQPRVNDDGPSQPQTTPVSSSAQGGQEASTSMASVVQNPPFGPPDPQQSPSLEQHPAVPSGKGAAGPALVPDLLTSELGRIPPPSLATLKQDLGMADKDVTAMTREEKIQLLRQFRYGPLMPAPSIMQPSHQHEARVLTAVGTASTEITPETVDAALAGIPPPTLAKLKRRLGMAGEDVATMTPLQKMRLVRLFRDGDTRARNGLPVALAAPNTGTPFGLGPAQVLPTVGGGHNVLYQPTPPQLPIPAIGMTGHPGNMPHPLPGFGALAEPADIRTRYAPGAPSATITPAPRTAYAWGPGVAGSSTAPNPAPMPTWSFAMPPPAPGGRVGNPNPDPDPDPDLRDFDAASCRALLNEMARNSNVDFSALNEAWRRGLAMARTEGAQ